MPDRPLKQDDDNTLKRRLLGAAVFIALAVIILPLLLDGSGSESRFRRVEQLREEPPRVIDPSAQEASLDKRQLPLPEPQKLAATSVEPVEQATGEDLSNEAGSKPDTRTKGGTLDAVAPTKPASSKPASSEPAPSELALSEPAPINQTVNQTVNQTPEKLTPNKPASVPGLLSDDVVNAIAWVIQAGSFSGTENALNMRDQLRDSGYPAFVSRADNSGTVVFRVKVGPINNRKEAGEVQKRLEAFLGRSTLIRKYR